MLEFFRDYLAPTGGIHLVSIGTDVTGRHFGTDYQAAAEWCIAENQSGKNIYWTANAVTPGLNKKPTKADIIGVRVAHVDIDPPKDNPSWDKQAALGDLILRGAPSVVISSGAGWQALWWLNEPTDVETVEQINRGIQQAFNADHCWNVDRLLRVPGGGLINYPDKRKQSLGRVPTPTALQQPFNGVSYSPSVLLERFPATVAPATVVEMLPSGPREDYTGPDDDDELIRMMLRSRGGMGAMFGEKATVADLWEADPETMAKFFPSDSGDDFNRSSADAALLAHLTFWTGNDPARIDRLFRRSGLMRDKWNRESYREISIGKATANCVNVYSTPQRTEVEPLQGEVVPGGEFMTIHEQKNHFSGCVYVTNEHKVLTPRGDLLKPDQFNVIYGGFDFEFGTDKVEKKAFTAFTESRLHQFPKVSRTTFNPTLPFGHIEHDAVNTYFPDPDVESVPGDVTPFLNHIALQYPDPRDQEIIWTWCASLVQNPGAKFQWALFLQGAEGNGKSMLAEVIKHAIGIRYYHKPNASDITNKFNDFMKRKLFIDVQEINIDDRYEIVENLKDWITSSWIEVQPKGGAKMMTENYANWMLVSNHKNAVPITVNQRRFAPIFGAQQTAEDVKRVFGGEYFPRLWKWLKGGGYSHMAHYLMTRPINPEFDPAGTGQAAARAPLTSSTNEAIGASLGRVEQEIIEAIDSGKQGFREPWISSTAVTALTKDLRLRISPVKLRGALESLGYEQWGRSSVLIMAEGGTKPVLYVKKGNEGLTVNDFIKAQGYGS